MDESMRQNDVTTRDELTEVAVLVPAEQVAGFYSLVGEWLNGGRVRGTGSGRRTVAARRGGGSSKYEPIGSHLKSMGGEVATLSFDEVEELIGGPLPSSARRHRAWWANTDTHSQASVWLKSGWTVARADLENATITFARA